MSSNNRILLITPGFPVDENDDITMAPVQGFLKNFLRQYRDYKFEIITLQYPFQKTIYEWNGCMVYSCGGRNRKFAGKLKTLYHANQFADHILKEKSVKLIHSLWLSEAALIGNRISKSRNMRHLVTLMGQDVLRSNNYLKILDLRKPEYVAVSPFQAQKFYESTALNANHIIPWGIDENEFHGPADKETSEMKYGTRFDIFGAGNLTSLKQYNIFVNVVREIAKKKPTVTAAIAGDGPERPALEKMIHSYGIAQNITLPGRLPRHEVLKMMSQSKVFLHTSSYESQGYACLEALAAGCNIVSFKTGIASSTKKWEIGTDIPDLAEAVTGFLDSGKNEPHIPYPVSATIKAYHDLYE